MTEVAVAHAADPSPDGESSAEPSPAAPSWTVFPPLLDSELLQAAAEAFTEAGYHGASVRDIAERAEVTVPTLYYHHGSKQGLLRDLLNASMADLVERSARALDEAGADPVDRFVDAVDCTVRFMCHRQRISRLDPESRYLDVEHRGSYLELRKRFEVRMLELLEEGLRAGRFDLEHPVDVNRALLGTYQSIAIWYREDGELTPAQIAARHVTFSLDAVRVSGDDRERGMTRVRSRLEAVGT